MRQKGENALEILLVPDSLRDGLPAVWQHLLQRVDQRRISVNDLLALQERVRTEPVAPEGDWYKDFGSFKICGQGSIPKTFLLRGQAATGMAGGPQEARGNGWRPAEPSAACAWRRFPWARAAS